MTLLFLPPAGIRIAGSYTKGELMQGKRVFFSKKRVMQGGSLWSLVVLPTAVFAADELNPGDTAWVFISTALVLFMMISGLAMFYAGLDLAEHGEVGYDL
jgi:hypothetical protein